MKAETLDTIIASANLPSDLEKETFGTIQLRPQMKIYENLEADEQALLCLGKHWSQLIQPAIYVGALSLLPPIGFITYALFSFSYPTIPQLLIATWFWYCLLFYYSISRIINWRADVYIITNERIIDFDDKAFFSEKVTDTDLDSIHEIRFETGGGLISGAMNKGKVILKDVSGGELVLSNVPHPSNIALILGELIEENKKEATVKKESL